jgi:hypothetical protein
VRHAGLNLPCPPETIRGHFSLTWLSEHDAATGSYAALLTDTTTASGMMAS